jgi:tetratricopeptide (TPR) repeat protein
MAILVEQKKFAELIKSFSNEAMGGAAPQTSWICPEDETVMADALYYRGIAYAEMGDLQAAEADLRTMVTKGNPLDYTPGDTVLAVAWKRLGDFYRTKLRDDAQALDAYRKALETKSNPAIRDELEAAAAYARKLEHQVP